MPAYDTRSVGLDVGDKRIGVAVSDALSITAQPLVVIERIGTRRDIAKLEDALAPYKISRVVVGLPVELDGFEGRQAERVRAFADAYADATGHAIIFQDERFTTAQSERLLVSSGVRRKKRRQVVDKMAATLILQAYLDTECGGSDEGV